MQTNYYRGDKRGGFMFPRIKTCNRKNNTYKYLILSKSIRKKGKGSTTVDIANLGNINKFQSSDIENIINGLIRIFSLESHCSTNNVQILSSLEYGAIIVCRKIFKTLDIDKTINKNLSKSNIRLKLDVAKYVEIMVINRCINPLSKLGVTRWIPTTCYSVMNEFKKLNLSPNYFYRSMDQLLKLKDEIELSIFKRLKNLFSVSAKLTFYDITSTYFHTDSCPISSKGYSRDHRPDKYQIIIGIVTSLEGYPIKHFVFHGNTKDETTVKSTVKALKKEYNIEETIFVGDRGMITKLNLESIIVEGYDYIMGVKYRQDEKSDMLFSEIGKIDKNYEEYNGLKIQEFRFKIKDFIIWKIKKILRENNLKPDEIIFDEFANELYSQNSNATKKEKLLLKKVLAQAIPELPGKVSQKILNFIRKYRGQIDDKLRYIYCLNSEIKELSAIIRKKNITEICKKLDSLFSSARLKNDILKIEQTISEIFTGYKKKLKKYFIFARDSKDKKAIGYTLNKNELKKSHDEDGVFILRTNRFDLSLQQVVKSYKNLKEVEKINYDLKNFVDLRPIIHSLETRVKAHVFICVMSVLLKRMFEIEYLKTAKVIEPLEEISKAKLVGYKIKHSETEDRSNIIHQVTELTAEQKRIFQLVGINNPVNLEKFL